MRNTQANDNARRRGADDVAWFTSSLDRIPGEIGARRRSMTEVIIYFAINASLLAMFAGLWALDRRPRTRSPALHQMSAITPTATCKP